MSLSRDIVNYAEYLEGVLYVAFHQAQTDADREFLNLCYGELKIVRLLGTGGEDGIWVRQWSQGPNLEDTYPQVVILADATDSDVSKVVKRIMSRPDLIQGLDEASFPG